MVARVKRMMRRKRRNSKTSYYADRHDYLQACYNHLVRYDARQSDIDSFLKFSRMSASHFNDDSLFTVTNNMLDSAGMP